MVLAREGYSTIGVVLVFSILVCYGAGFIHPWAAWFSYVFFGGLTLLTIYFFRDPERTPPKDSNLIISPADGTVVLVKEIEEETYLKQKATQISIFLSPLNVHVNRVPLSGIVEYVKYHPGKYLMAWEDGASELNERADFGLLHESGIKIFFKQITGFLARRIVYYIDEGEQVQAGQRFGIMKFGSRMDVVVPSGVEVNVKKGDKTVAGVSVIGVIKDKDEVPHTTET